MATLNKGETFVNGETVTATRLNNLVDNATLSNVDRDDVSSTSRLLTVAESAPADQAEGELRYKSSEQRVLVKTSTGEVGLDGEMLMTYDENGNGTLDPFSPVVMGADANTVRVSTTEADPKVVGVCVNDSAVSDGEVVRIARTGLRTVRLDSATTAAVGEWIYTSGTGTGRVTTSTTMSPGAFGLCVTAGGPSGNITALIKEAPAAAIPSGALIIWDESTTCPPGFTEDTTWNGYVPMGFHSATGLTNGVGASIGGLTPGDAHPEGKNFYEVDDEAAAIANASGGGTGSYFNVTAGSSAGSSLGIISAGVQDSGNHRHSLYPLTNIPNAKLALFCRKD